MGEKSLADKLLVWHRLVEGTKGRAGELSFLEEEFRELAALRDRVAELVKQQHYHESRLRGATKKRIEAEAQADELSGRVVGALKARYGKYSPVLHEFGLRPNHPPGPRGKAQETPPPAEETTSAEETASAEETTS